MRYFLRFIIKNSWEGAQTTLYCALSPNLVSGGYYSDCILTTANPQALNETVGSRLWDISMKLVDCSDMKL